MNLFTTVIAVLMVADSTFTLINLDKVESMLKSFFPNLNIKLLALIEGAIGMIALLIKIKMKTLK